MGRGCMRGLGPRVRPVDDSANLLVPKGLLEGYPAIMGFNVKHKRLG